MGRYRVFLLALLVAAGLLAWLLQTRVLAPPAVRTAVPVHGTLTSAVYATGVVEPVEWAMVRAETAGRIVLLARAEGEVVAPGDLLAQFDDQQPRARLAEIDARIRFLAAERARQRALVGGGASSRKSLELLQADYEQAAAQRALALDVLRQSRLAAPIGGRVLRRDGRVGERVEVGTPLFWIGDPDRRLVVAQVDEEYFPRIELGQAALATADAYPERTFAGRVVERTPLGDAGQRSYRIKVALDGGPADPLALPPIGMTVEVNVIVRTVEAALTIPRAALAGAGVWLVEAGRARFRPLRLGIRTRDTVEILDGLVGTEEVIIDPPVSLAEGHAVRAVRSAVGRASPPR